MRLLVPYATQKYASENAFLYAGFVASLMVNIKPKRKENLLET